MIVGKPWMPYGPPTDWCSVISTAPTLTTPWNQHIATVSVLSISTALISNQILYCIKYKKPHYFYQTCKAYDTYKTANIFLLLQSALDIIHFYYIHFIISLPQGSHYIEYIEWGRKLFQIRSLGKCEGFWSNLHPRAMCEPKGNHSHHCQKWVVHICFVKSSSEI